MSVKKDRNDQLDGQTIGYRNAKCRKCKRHIRWLLSAQGKWIACNYGIVTTDDLVFELTTREVLLGGRGMLLHSSTCTGVPKRMISWW